MIHLFLDFNCCSFCTLKVHSLALNYLSAEARAKYGPVFDVLMPSYGPIAASFSEPLRGDLQKDSAEYVIVRNRGGVNQAYFIYFTRDANGVWLLDSM